MQSNESGLSELAAQVNQPGPQGERAKEELLARLWAIYGPIAYRGLSHRPSDRSEVVASAFREFAKELQAGKISANNRRHLIGIIKRKICDKVCEYSRKQARRNELAKVAPEADLLVGAGSEEGGISQWTEARLDPLPEFAAMMKEIFEIITEPELREVLAAKLDGGELRSDRQVAGELGVTSRRVRSLRLRLEEQLRERCAWFREEAEKREQQENRKD